MSDPSDGQSSSSQPEESAIVLAAVDTSPAAGRVIDIATRMVRRTWHNGQLHIVHVFRVGPLVAVPPSGLPVEELENEAKEYLDYNVRVATRLCGAPATGHFVRGDAEEQVVRLARALSVDLIVVGANDPVGPRRWLFKSVAQRLAKNAPCPVLVVRHKQRPYIKVA